MRWLGKRNWPFVELENCFWFNWIILATKTLRWLMLLKMHSGAFCARVRMNYGWPDCRATTLVTCSREVFGGPGRAPACLLCAFHVEMGRAAIRLTLPKPRASAYKNWQASGKLCLAHLMPSSRMCAHARDWVSILIECNFLLCGRHSQMTLGKLAPN